MTEEAKENIIKYLTNNITESTPSSDLIYSTPTTATNNLSSQLSSALGNNYKIIDIIQGKTSQGNETQLALIYGNYTSSYNKGFAAIIDDKGNLIQIFTQYSSGTTIGQIHCLNVREDGRFYMIESNTSNNKFRYVLLNNVLAKLQSATEYSFVLRTSYYIPETSIMYNATSITKIIKAVGQAKYLIGGVAEDSTTGYKVPVAVELTVNFGASNEWKDFKGDSYMITPSAGYDILDNIDIYAFWNNDNIEVTILGILQQQLGSVLKYTIDPNTLENDVIQLEYENISISYLGTPTNQNLNIKILNDTKGYLAMTCTRGSNGKDNFIYELNLQNNSSLNIYTQEAFTLDNNLNGSVLQTINNEIIFLTIYNDIDNEFYINVGRVREDSTFYSNPVSIYQIYSASTLNIDILLLYVNKQFNLYNFNVLFNNQVYNTYQIYNVLNYNGVSFEGKKSIMPNSGILYDNNNKVIFARNLYNRVIQGGTTTSTIEVPNNYINEITISNKNLLSFNNNVLVSDTENITKNQYETLDINFINTLTMINENNITNPIINTTGASRLNNSISNDVDYSDATISKVRLNYNDNTKFVKEINSATQISQYVYQFNFDIYVPSGKTIPSIDIISGDEETIYISIDTSNLLQGKTYKISQNVEIQ